MGSFKTYVGNEPPHIQGAPVVTNFWFWNLHVAVGQCNRYINHIYKVIPRVTEVEDGFSGIELQYMYITIVWEHIRHALLLINV